MKVSPQASLGSEEPSDYRRMDKYDCNIQVLPQGHGLSLRGSRTYRASSKKVIALKPTDCRVQGWPQRT